MEKKINNAKLLLYMDEELKKVLEMEAASFDLSLSAYIRQLLKHRKETLFYDKNIKNQ